MAPESLSTSTTRPPSWQNRRPVARSEEHTSELQSLRHLVCRLLLEKKKTRQKQSISLIGNLQQHAATQHHKEAYVCTCDSHLNPVDHHASVTTSHELAGCTPLTTTQ